jgi:osmotically-inducible protein OsmY
MSPSLKQSVQDAMKLHAPLNASRQTISVTVEDSRVFLSGYVPSTSAKRIASVLAAGVDGVSEVINDLISGPELERRVASALATDHRTSAWPVRVRVDRGYVQLQGYVPNKEAIETALQVARQVEGARQVISRLKVEPALAVADSQDTLALSPKPVAHAT